MAQKKSAAKKGISAGTVVGITALAAAGVAAGIFLFGKNGPKNRKAIKSWTLKAKADILEKMEKAKDMSEETYHSIVDAATAKYAKLKDVTPDELAALTGELKKHWKAIKSEAGGAKKAVKKSAKAVKKAAK
jgi:gas vesicle protein